MAPQPNLNRGARVQKHARQSDPVSRPVRAVSCLACSARSCCISPLHARQCAMSPPSPTCARPASLLLPPAPSPTSLSLLLSLSVLRKHLHMGGDLCRARTRMREIWCVTWCVGGVWRTRRARPRSLCRRRSCLAPRMIDDGPLSGPKRQNSSEKAARARHAAPAGSPDPTDALAHRDSPCAGPRSLPSTAWIGFALLYIRLSEKGSKLKPGARAAMIKNKMKTMGNCNWG